MRLKDFTKPKLEATSSTGKQYPDSEKGVQDFLKDYLSKHTFVSAKPDPYVNRTWLAVIKFAAEPNRSVRAIVYLPGHRMFSHGDVEVED